MKAVNFLILAFVLFLYSCNDNNNPVTPTTTPGEKPEVALISPTEQTEIIDSVTVDISAKDNKGITRVDFIVDNVIVKSWPVGPYKAVVDLSMYNDSSWHSAYAKAYDADSNFTTTPVIKLTVRRLLAPDSLWAESLSENIVKLHWKDKSIFETGYQIEEAEFNGTYSIIGTTAANDSLFIVNNLDTSKEYSFRVKPIRNNNVGASSSIYKIDYLTSWSQGTYIYLNNYSLQSILYYNDLLITGTSAGIIQINNYTTGKLVKIIPAHSNYIQGLCVNPDGSTFASSSQDYYIKIWSLTDYSLVLSIYAGSTYNSIRYSPDGTMIAGISSYTMKIWNTSTGTLIRTINTSNSSSGVLFSKDGSIVLLSDGNSIKFYRISDGLLLKTITGISTIYSLNQSPDGLTLAAGLANGTINLYDVGSGILENTLIIGYSNSIRSLWFSYDGKLLLSSDNNGSTRLWDLNSSECIYSINNYGYYPSFGKDNNSIITGYSSSIYILNKTTEWKTFYNFNVNL